MSAAEDFAGDLRDRLNSVAAEGRRIDFWWRDDDAVAPSRALDTLVDAAHRHRVPLVLAVIPEPAQAELADRLAGVNSGVVVVQHGIAHRNHAPAGEKAVELGVHRPADIVLDELRVGRDKLVEMFGDRFLPVLTPPWNRICDEVAARRGEAGLIGLSTFAELYPDDPACLNTHVDIIDWKRGRKFAGYEKMAKVLGEEICRRDSGKSKPLGLLTHHLDHDAGAREFIEVFLSVSADHPAVGWPSPAALFGLD